MLDLTAWPPAFTSMHEDRRRAGCDRRAKAQITEVKQETALGKGEEADPEGIEAQLKAEQQQERRPRRSSRVRRRTAIRALRG
jgi:hypothetical protein